MKLVGLLVALQNLASDHVNLWTISVDSEQYLLSSYNNKNERYPSLSVLFTVPNALNELFLVFK